MSTKRGFIASRNARRSDGSFSTSRNKRFTKDGTPIQYVFIDESGHPYYDEEGPHPLVLGAVVTDDPDELARIVLSTKRKKSSNGSDELKSSRVKDGSRSEFMDMMQEGEMKMFVTSQTISDPVDHGKGSSIITYNGALSRLLVHIAKVGPKGIYRIRIDESEYIYPELSDILVKAAFDDVPDKSIANNKPFGIVDSEFNYQIQAADVLAGTYRKTIKTGTSEEFVERRGIEAFNKKPKKDRSTPWIVDSLRHSRQSARTRAKSHSRSGQPHPSRQSGGRAPRV